MLTQSKCVLNGAGRTDSGVHALGQVAHFDTFASIPPDKYVVCLNNILPDDIRISCSSEVDKSFDARYSAKGKLYEYKIVNDVYESVFKRRDHTFVPVALDAERMNAAAKYFIGTHDFLAFTSVKKLEGLSLRTIWDCGVVRRGNEIIISVSGISFLFHMVRIITGTLIEVGGGKRAPEDIPEILKSGDRGRAGDTAPAKGLTLIEVYY